MGKSSDPKRRRKPAPPPERQSRDRAAVSEGAADEVEFLPPLKPRPKLLMILSAVFALWLALLLVLRFTTVTRHGQEQEPQSEPTKRQPVEGTVPRARE